MVNTLGDGLTVVIRAEHRLHCDWMAFAAWYSIGRILPDAKTYLLLHRCELPKCQFFLWPERVGLRRWMVKSPEGGTDPLVDAARAVLAHGAVSQPMLVMDASVLALRGPSPSLLDVFNGDGEVRSTDGLVRYFSGVNIDRVGAGEPKVVTDLCVAAKDYAITAFSSYRDGVGKFVTDTWIDRVEYPFPLADRLASPSMSANEAQVLKLWKLTQPVFETVSRA